MLHIDNFTILNILQFWKFHKFYECRKIFSDSLFIADSVCSSLLLRSQTLAPVLDQFVAAALMENVTVQRSPEAARQESVVFEWCRKTSSIRSNGLRVWYFEILGILRAPKCPGFWFSASSQLSIRYFKVEIYSETRTRGYTLVGLETSSIRNCLTINRAYAILTWGSFATHVYCKGWMANEIPFFFNL